MRTSAKVPGVSDKGIYLINSQIRPVPGREENSTVSAVAISIRARDRVVTRTLPSLVRKAVDAGKLEVGG